MVLDLRYFKLGNFNANTIKLFPGFSQMLETDDVNKKKALKQEWDEIYDRMLRIQHKMDVFRASQMDPTATSSNPQQPAATPAPPTSASELPFQQLKADLVQAYVTKLKDLTKDYNKAKVWLGYASHLLKSLFGPWAVGPGDLTCFFYVCAF